MSTALNDLLAREKPDLPQAHDEKQSDALTDERGARPKHEALATEVVREKNALHSATVQVCGPTAICVTVHTVSPFLW